MPCVLYSEARGAYALLDRWRPEFDLPAGDISIPCEAGADVNDQERWRAEAAAMREHGWPAASLDMARALKKYDLTVARDIEVTKGFPYGGYVFPLNTDIQLSLMVQFQGCLAMPAPSYAWKDATGVYRDIGDAQAFQKFATSAMAYGESLYSRERELQNRVDTAETIEEAAAVRWDETEEAEAPAPPETPDVEADVEAPEAVVPDEVS